MIFKNPLVRRIEKSLDPGELVMLFDEARAEGKLEDGTLRKLRLEQPVLRGINLSGADLRGAELPRADLRGAVLRDARLNDVDFSGATLCEVDFTGADLTNAIMIEVDLTGATITAAQLARLGALVDAKMPDGSVYDGRYILPEDLSLAEQDDVFFDNPAGMAEWLGVTLEVYEVGQGWSDQHLAELRVESAYELAGPANDWAGLARKDGKLTDGSLRGVDLRHEDLTLNDLHEAVLPEVVMIGVEARRADFSGANLERADLSEANLIEARFVGANLRGAWLEEAELDDADLENADLTDAEMFDTVLVRANLKAAKVTEVQLAQVNALTRATMPDGTRYDGRYDLEGDMIDAEDSGVDLTSVIEIAHWYDIEVEVYEAGQVWAKMNLPKLRPEDFS
jgi:uncharacterized protein YjbI with pentapeptide repeats